MGGGEKSGRGGGVESEGLIRRGRIRGGHVGGNVSFRTVEFRTKIFNIVLLFRKDVNFLCLILFRFVPFRK